jgi:hypothetical protein
VHDVPTETTSRRAASSFTSPRKYSDAFIGVATETRGFGWINYWNTKSVPNGTYTLNSVATDPAGNIGRKRECNHHRSQLTGVGIKSLSVHQ